MDVRSAFLEAATDLYGLGSMEYRAVMRAFGAIRVGAGWQDTQPPEILYAQIYDVDPRERVAKLLVIARDDTGLGRVEVRGASGSGPLKGVLDARDYFIGYIDIDDATTGTNTVTLTLDDGSGHTVETKRSFFFPVKARTPNLICDGSFERDAPCWKSDGDVYRIGDDASRAFVGTGYAVLGGVGRLWQKVEIPEDADDVQLSVRILTGFTTQAGETLSVQVRSEEGELLETLETFTYEGPETGWNFANRGYVRRVYDLTKYAGQTVRITFDVNTTVDVDTIETDYIRFLRFLVDQVKLTFQTEIEVGLPEVTVRPWENTVTFRLPNLQGVPWKEVARVEYFVDNTLLAAGQNRKTRFHATVLLDDLGPGPHWVAARVRLWDHGYAGNTPAVWFSSKTVHELLENGGFETGAWDLTYSDPPPYVQVATDGPDFSVVFDGEQALYLGGRGYDPTAGDDDTSRAPPSVSEAGQLVTIPPNAQALRFSVRVREDVGFPGPDVLPFARLAYEIRDPETYEILAEGDLVPFRETGLLNRHDEKAPFIQEFPASFDDAWRWYRYVEATLPAPKLRARTVIFKLKLFEWDPDRKVGVYLDNASLWYRPPLFQVGPIGP